MDTPPIYDPTKVPPIAVQPTAPSPTPQPGGVSNSMMQQVQQRIDQNDQQRLALEGQADQMRVQHAEREMQGDQRLSALEAQPLPDYPQMRNQLQPPDMSKVFNAKEYESLSYGLIGMALVGGVASKDWYGVNAVLGGALKGYHDGQLEQASRLADDYKMQMQVATQTYQQQLDAYKDILNRRDISVRQMQHDIQTLAAQNHHEDMLMSARTGQLDRVAQRLQARQKQLEGIGVQHEKISQQLTLAREKMNFAQSQNPPLTEEAIRQQAEVYQAGGTPLSPRQHAIANASAGNGQSGTDIVNSQITQKAEQSAARTSLGRQQAVEALSGTVKGLESRINILYRRLNNSGLPAYNRVANDLIHSGLAGTPQQQELVEELRDLLVTEGRQFVKTVTGATSNAQMSVSAQNTAEGMLNLTMTYPQLKGAFEAMNTEIEAERKTLAENVARSRVGGATVEHNGEKKKVLKLNDWLVQ